MNDDLRDLSMLELFRVETENQTALLTSGLLELEATGKKSDGAGGGSELGAVLESLMRAAHSLKGAARIVNLPVAVRIAHAMEDCFVAAQHGRITLGQAAIDALLQGVDLLGQIARRDESNVVAWENDHTEAIQKLLAALAGVLAGHPPARSPITVAPTPALTARAEPKTRAASRTKSKIPSPHVAAAPPPIKARPQVAAATGPAPDRQSPSPPPVAGPASDRVLRLTAENLNRLLGLAGESLVESRWLRPFSDSMQRLDRMQSDLADRLDRIKQKIAVAGAEGGREPGLGTLPMSTVSDELAGFQELFRESRRFLDARLQELDLFDRRSAHLSNRLYLEVLRARMRPFADGTQRFPRMVRDLARALGKQARLEIIGENTQVDRDILERLETPLGHLLRNAVDHGCETSEQRQRAGKPPEAVIRLEARHAAGMLQVVVSDDGAGVDSERVRRSIVEKKLATPLLADRMHEGELLEFLFLPGFTMKDRVTEISGRGVGLDVVQSMVRAVRGNVRIHTQPGRGTKFQLQLPLTLSVLRTLLVEIGGEPYAFPLAQIAHTLMLPRGQIETLEGRRHFKLGDRQVGLLTAHEVLDCGKPRSLPQNLPVVVLGDRLTFGVSVPSRSAGAGQGSRDGERAISGTHRGYGLIVDRFFGERELVVQPLDPRLGKVQDISAAALMEDGAPVLIVDVDDMTRSIEKLVAAGTLADVQSAQLDAPKPRKRILAVDDSLTVRELERKLLLNRGYQADVAVDGMDGWNAVRTGVYDLVITDVDMPRMDGIELTRLIKQDARLKSLPVMIVSYKDREEDRLRGLDAGADYYLTKGSFHDEKLLEAVLDLIGEPGA